MLRVEGKASFHFILQVSIIVWKQLKLSCNLEQKSLLTVKRKNLHYIFVLDMAVFKLQRYLLLISLDRTLAIESKLYTFYDYFNFITYTYAKYVDYTQRSRKIKYNGEGSQSSK